MCACVCVCECSVTEDRFIDFKFQNVRNLISMTSRFIERKRKGKQDLNLIGYDNYAAESSRDKNYLKF